MKEKKKGSRKRYITLGIILLIAIGIIYVMTCWISGWNGREQQNKTKKKG